MNRKLLLSGCVILLMLATLMANHYRWNCEQCDQMLKGSAVGLLQGLRLPGKSNVCWYVFYQEGGTWHMAQVRGTNACEVEQLHFFGDPPHYSVPSPHYSVPRTDSDGSDGWSTVMPL